MAYVTFNQITNELVGLTKIKPRGHKHVLFISAADARELGLSSRTKSKFRVGWDNTEPGLRRIYSKSHNPVFRWSNQEQLLAELAASSADRLHATITTRVQRLAFKKLFFAKAFTYLPEPIEYLEFGVHRGASLQLVASLLKHSGSRLHGFDTFSGYPEPWLVKDGLHRDAADYSLSRAEKIALRKILSDRRIRLHKGPIQKTLPNFLKSKKRQNPKLIYINSDLYGSALFVLFSLFPLLGKNTVVVMSLAGESHREAGFRALNDFSQATLTRYRIEFLVDANSGWHVAFRLKG
jgi:hypothetical protein